MDNCAQDLRQRFAHLNAFVCTSEWPISAAQTPAAVLVPLLVLDSGLHVLLTRRTDHLLHHAGQISFPGGRTEAFDQSPVHTALRETEEEIGIHPSAIEVLGCLPERPTPSGFCITPVVGLIQGDVSLTLDAFEVDSAFEVPVSFVTKLDNYQRHRISRPEGDRFVYALPYRGHFIWGATAGILHMMASFLGETS